MKILTLRDNQNYTRLGDGFTDSIPVVGSVISLIGSLTKLFGGESAGGYDESGRFIPGDIDNRLKFFAQRLQEYGLSAADIDKILVDTFIYQPSGWQANIDNYVLQVYQDKLANPEKYKNKTPGNTGGGGTNLAGMFSGMSVTTILLIGAAVYFGAQMLGKKRGRR